MPITTLFAANLIFCTYFVIVQNEIPMHIKHIIISLDSSFYSLLKYQREI